MLFIRNEGASLLNDVELEWPRHDTSLTRPSRSVFDGLRGVAHHLGVHLTEPRQLGHVILAEPFGVLRLDVERLLRTCGPDGTSIGVNADLTETICFGRNILGGGSQRSPEVQRPPLYRLFERLGARVFI
jgi:hypothetical protein